MDALSITTVVFAAVAAVAAAISAVASVRALGVARATLDEARSSGHDLQTAAVTLRKVLDQEQDLTELQRVSITELKSLSRDQRQLAAAAGLHRRLERLSVLGGCVEEVRPAAEHARQEALYGRDTGARIAAALGQLSHSIAALGGATPVPNCASLARGHVADYARNGVDILAARGEVSAAIVSARSTLQQLEATPYSDDDATGTVV